jgi:hypothetical protein
MTATTGDPVADSLKAGQLKLLRRSLRLGVDRGAPRDLAIILMVQRSCRRYRAY